MLIFDIETDGLLDTLTQIHCLCIYNTETEKYTLYRPNEVLEGIQQLACADKICGHNIIAFDLPAIEKVYGTRFDRDKVVDTLVLSRLVFNNLSDTDNGLLKRGVLPSSLWGSHSLKAHGYRLGILKGTYAEETEDCWAVFNEDMLEYNKQDVVVTAALYNKLQEKGYTEQASVLEHKAQWLMVKQEKNGYPFDIKKAYELKNTLDQEYFKVTKELTDIAPPIPNGVFIPKRDNKALGYKAGVPVQRYKEYNPTSRQQLRYILEEHYKYEFTEDMCDRQGKLVLDEETLKKIEKDNKATDDIKHVASLYRKSFLLSKRLGQLAEGKHAWLKTVADDGCIHGRVNPNGAVTGRATHSSPNLAQVPNAGSPYGKECRELFTVPNGWYQAGIDCSGLELRCLAHYMAPYDEGAYAHEILNGDIHTANQENAGLQTRNQAKRFIYSFLYGAGNEKIGEVVEGTAEDGKRLKEKFLKNTPALKKLQSAIKNSLSSYNHRERQRVWKRTYLLGLDGRKLHVRSLHSALNLLLQSAGALICKQWVVRLEERLLNLGYKHGWHGDFVFMAWVHDEVQIACKDKRTAEVVVYEAQCAIRDVQKIFNFRVQLDTEGKIGRNWYETH